MEGKGIRVACDESAFPIPAFWVGLQAQTSFRVKGGGDFACIEYEAQPAVHPQASEQTALD